MMSLSIMGLVSIQQTATAAVVPRCNIEGQMRFSTAGSLTCTKTSTGLFFISPKKLSGSLTIVCGATEAWCNAMSTKFTELSNVNTRFVRLSSGVTAARLEAAKNNPEFDVWHGGPADSYGVARNKDLLDKYESPTRNAIPKKYQDADGYWTGVYVGALGFCSNTKELRRLGVALPTSWADLLNPKLKKSISSAHPATSGTAFTTFWTNVTRLGSEAAGMEYMKALHNNVLQYTSSGIGPVAIVGRGEAAVGLVFSHDCVAGAEQGLPLKVSFPSEGTGFEIGGVALIKGSKNPEAARAYIDFALSAQAQNLGPGVASYQVLTHPKARPDLRSVKLKSLKLVDYDFVKAAAAKPGLTAKFEDQIAARPKS